MKIQVILKTILIFFRWKSLEWQERTDYKDAILLAKMAYKKRKMIFLFNTPTYNNLGDQAIAIAENKFIKKFFADYEVIEFPGHLSDQQLKIISMYLPSFVKILITGGGYMGSLWSEEEQYVQLLVKSFPKNKIVVLPQTVYFENSDESNNLLDISKSVYCNHQRLIFSLRDTKSFNFIKQNFSNVNINLCPDMVMYYNYTDVFLRQNIILMCFREDKEKIISEDLQEDIFNILASQFTQYNIKKISTLSEKSYIEKDKRLDILNEKLKEFGSSKLVVTDRLHGMIFAAITSTPCIAFDNVSGKIGEGYQWIKNNPHIKLVRDKNEFLNALNELDLEKTYSYDNTPILHYYEELSELIRGKL